MAYLQQIYIQLLDEGTPVWRPTYGKSISETAYEVLPTDSYDIEDETWEFPPGSVVECEFRVLGGERVLVATRAIS